MNHDNIWLVIATTMAGSAGLCGFAWGRLTSPSPDTNPPTRAQFEYLKTRLDGSLRVLESGVDSKFRTLEYTLDPLRRRTSALENDVRALTRQVHSSQRTTT